MSLIETLIHKFREFCLKTSLQGFKFIYLPKISLLERFFWIVTIVTSIIVTLIFIFISKNRMEGDPTQLLTESINNPISKYPFPAVTVCPFNKISKTGAMRKAQKIPNKMNYTTQEIYESLITLSHLYFPKSHLSRIENEKMLKLVHILDNNAYDISKLLEDLSPPCNMIIEKCKWKQEEKSCNSLFEKILTTEGYCCSFNFFALKNFTSNKRVVQEPRRVSASGSHTSLEVIVNTKPEEYTVSEVMSYGSKIIIHSSYDFPDWTQQTFLLGLKTLAHIEGNPTITVTPEDLRSVDVSKRFCYFEDEFDLYYSRHYTYHNCLAECRMNYSFFYCGCIPVVYVNGFDKPAIRRICSVRDVACLSEYKILFASTLPGLTWEEVEEKFGSYKVETCSCLPDCSPVEYDFRISSATFNEKYSSFQSKWSSNITLKHHSLFRVFFNNLVGTKNRRTLRMNWQSDLAFYGGILGFFIGFNIISSVEFLFFFTVKLIINLWNRYENPKKSMEKKSDFVKIQKIHNYEHSKVVHGSWYLP